MAYRRSGGFDVGTLERAALLQYVAWVGGTTLGGAGSSLVRDPTVFGLGVLFPVFYLAILLPEIRTPHRPLLVAAVSATVTAVLIPLTPVGVPVLAGAGAALLGLRRPP